LYYDVRDNSNYAFALFGAGNGCDIPYLKHQEKVDLLRTSRIALCIGTPHANNTYSFVEAWVMGIPQVIFGKELWNTQTYEVGELVTHGENGFIANTIDEAINHIDILMKNYDLARYISENSREKAVSIYGREVLSQQWQKFFKEIGAL
jgi:glycosyltransferase involved in cell wall biosynthesis